MPLYKCVQLLRSEPRKDVSMKTSEQSYGESLEKKERVTVNWVQCWGQPGPGQLSGGTAQRTPFLGRLPTLMKNTCISIGAPVLRGKWTAACIAIKIQRPHSLQYNTPLSWFIFIFSIKLFLWFYLLSRIFQGKIKIISYQRQSYAVSWILSPLKFIYWHPNPQDLNCGLI